MAAEEQVTLQIIEQTSTVEILGVPAPDIVTIIAPGPPGPPGEPGGPEGPQGIQGPPGEDGAVIVGSGNILTGAGAPDNGDGNDEDIYLDTTSADVYQKESGVWVLKTNIRGSQGAQGIQGTAGVDGRTIFAQTGVPSIGLGSDGDVTFRTSTGDFYKKIAGVWVLQANLIGPAGADGTNGVDGADGTNGTNGTDGADGVDGADGSVWRSGVGAPSNALGQNSDFYLNRTTYDLYEKAAGVYSVIDNIKGADGTNGVDGDDGTNGTNGVDGDDGTNGTNGVDGTVWREGSGAPSNVLGVNGDFYLDTATGDVYKKTAGVYAIVTNIMGDDGADGTNGTDGDDGTNGTNGQGVPIGGATNEVLRKINGTDYNTEWHALVKGDVGLGNVDNTSDVNKPVSTAQQTALDLKANLASPALTGNPTAPTQSPGDNSTKLATTAYVEAAVAAGVSAISGDLIFKGAWDASAGTFPGAGAAQSGWFYRVSVAGTVNGQQFDVGDDVYAIVNNASTTVYAANWLQIQGVVDSGDITTALGYTPVPETRQVNGHALTGDVTVTATDVGLGNVTNTSDANKPVSTAQQTALDLKSNILRSIVEYTADQTTQLTDNGKIVELNKATAINYTVAPNSTIAHAIGTQIDLVMTGAGQAAIVAGVGVTITSDSSKLKIGVRYGSVTLYKRALNTWNLSGNLIA